MVDNLCKGQPANDEGGGAVLVAGHRETAAADSSVAYRDAYRYGRESRAQSTSTWDEATATIEQGWVKAGQQSGLAWADVKDAVRDGWDRVERTSPGEDVATSEGMPEGRRGQIVADATSRE